LFAANPGLFEYSCAADIDEMSVMDASIAIKYLVNIVQDPKLDLSPKKNQSRCSTHQGLHTRL